MFIEFSLSFIFFEIFPSNFQFLQLFWILESLCSWYFRFLIFASFTVPFIFYSESIEEFNKTLSNQFKSFSTFLERQRYILEISKGHQVRISFLPSRKGDIATSILQTQKANIKFISWLRAQGQTDTLQIGKPLYALTQTLNSFVSDLIASTSKVNIWYAFNHLRWKIYAYFLQRIELL